MNLPLAFPPGCTVEVLAGLSKGRRGTVIGPGHPFRDIPSIRVHLGEPLGVRLLRVDYCRLVSEAA